MKRRELFQMGATLAAGALVGCATTSAGEPAAPHGERSPGATGDLALPHHELEEVSIAELGARLASGAETARSLVAKYRARIAACNDRLRAVIAVAPDAEAIAAQLDAGPRRGPLHGIPILVKDNIDTAGLATTAGSLALEGTVPTADAPIIAALRAAGAIILGKTNLSEWANFRGEASCSGWSALGGQCRNPYALDRTPSGSSSGSAVATAASLCAAALGSETDGSIVSPASCTALVGIKPTIGLVSRTGVIPISASQDTVGPLARTVADAALLLAAIAGADPRDPVTAGHAAADYARALDPKALAGARLGVPREGWFGVSHRMDARIEIALRELASLGAVIVDPVDIPVPAELAAAELEVLQSELDAGMTAYLATRGAGTRPRTLGDLIAFNAAHADRELRLFGQELFEKSRGKGDLLRPAYTQARATCLRIARDGLDRALADHRLDAIVAGTSGPPWLIDPINGDSPGAGCSTLPAVAGYPHVTVCAGFVEHLPIGLSFIGRPFSEAQLIGYAYAYEHATHHREPPRFSTSAGPRFELS